MQEFYLATFDSTHHALKFEKNMKSNGININVIPVPRELTANCGLAVMFFEHINNVKAIAQANDVAVKAYYYVTSKDNKKEYKVLE